MFPPQIRAEEVVLVWQAGRVCKELVKRELEGAIQDEDEMRVSILKRGAPFFVLATVGTLLHHRNGQTFLNKLKAEVAASKKTTRRLTNYATVALEWYVEAMRELVDAGQEVASLVRSQEGWRKVRTKINSKWKVYSLAKDVVENSLPKL